jgi:hypothetical protein
LQTGISRHLTATTGFSGVSPLHRLFSPVSRVIILPGSALNYRTKICKFSEKLLKLNQKHVTMGCSLHKQRTPVLPGEIQLNFNRKKGPEGSIGKDQGSRGQGGGA